MSDRGLSTATQSRLAAPSSSAPRTAISIWVVLLMLAAVGWAVTIFEARGMRGMEAMPGMAGMPAASTPGWPFLFVWAAMMVAMMFPSVGPAVTAFAGLSRDRHLGGRGAAPPWAFLLGYLTIWGVFGMGAYALSFVVPEVGMMAPGLHASSPVAAGVILIIAGVYQWAPLKRLCLEHCRAPLPSFRQGWREGVIGAFRVGLTHGTHCVGGCGGLMLVLFAVGLMNLGWMALLATVFFAEKVIPVGPDVGRVAGAAVVGFGVALVGTPWLG